MTADLNKLLDAYRDAVAKAIINADILVSGPIALANEQQARAAVEAYVEKHILDAERRYQDLGAASCDELDALKRENERLTKLALDKRLRAARMRGLC